MWTRSCGLTPPEDMMRRPVHKPPHRPPHRPLHSRGLCCAHICSFLQWCNYCKVCFTLTNSFSMREMSVFQHIDFLPRLIPSMSLLKKGSSTKVNGWTLSITNSQISWLTLFWDMPKLLFYCTNKTCTPMYAFVLFWNICFGKSMFVQVVINKWGSIPLKIICDLLLIIYRCDYYTNVVTIQMMGYLEHHTLNIVFSIFIEVCDRYPIVFTFLQAVRTILLSKFGFGHRSNSFVVKV